MRAFSIAVGLLAILGACAPRMTNTHYERWSTQDAKRRAEAAEEEKAAAAQAPGGAPKPSTPVAPPRTATPATPPGDTGYSSFSGSGTPPVKTATKSRAIQPPPEDEDAIY
ncbi:MAG: hypothetical protein IT384_29690 [Deltaproteobacteria bacterium]|nr:hypothetical protein [Deltaproteobacteria bacterium]